MIRRTRVFRAGLPALAPARKAEMATITDHEAQQMALAFVKRFV
jgi:hypothetical protein